MSVKKSPKSLNSPPTSTTNNFEQSELPQRSSGDMSASAAASAAAIALALDLKPKHPIITDTQQQLHQLQQQAAQLQQQQQQQQQQHHQQQHQQQKIKKCVFRSKPYKQRPFTRSLNRKLLTKISCKTLSSNPKTTHPIILPPPPSPLPPPFVHHQQHALTKEKFLFTLDLLAVVRRNASDKLKLIQMVHDNPILWDSRLPNFKGAEEEKNRAWELIGKEFNAPGRRVARAFKSLRESYRRELAHVKLMGSNFKPKWSLYDAMDFLRDVIRERKGGSHAAEHSGSPLGLNLVAFAQHMTASANNNIASNNNNNNNNSNTNKNNNNYKLNNLHSPYSDSALNLSKCSSTNNSSADDYYNYFVKPELDINNQNTNPNANTAAVLVNGSGGSGAATASLNIPPAHQNSSQNNDSRVSSTRNDTSNANNTYDDLDNSSMRSGEDGENSSLRNTALSHHGSDEVEELEAIDADFPYPLILNSTSPSTSNNNNNCAGGPPSKRRRKHLQSTGEDDEDDEEEDDYEGQMLQQHRHLRAQQNQGGLMNGLNDMMPPPQTVREVLNSKFCGFISAKLNSMEDSEADNLMNKILMLLVQTQMSQSQAAAVLAVNNTNDTK